MSLYKRLHEVQGTTGASNKRRDPVLDLVASGEDEHARRRARRSQGAQYFKPRDAGQHQIENHQVVLVRFDLPQGSLAVAGMVHGESLAAKVGRECGGEPGGVLDDQQFHRRSVTRCAAL